MAEPRAFLPLNIAVLTISDTRNETEDKSGRLLVERLQETGHRLAIAALKAFLSERLDFDVEFDPPWVNGPALPSRMGSS